MRVVAATSNRHKIREIKDILRPFGLEIISKGEAGADGFDIEEDGENFEENSEKKARVIMEAGGLAAIADDSGLLVDFLGGAPGVYSARFAGVDGGDADAANNRKLLALLRGVPAEKRAGRFVSVVTLVYPGGRALSASGVCEGRIGFEERGESGFGYDPLFIPVGFEKTFAELSEAEKNRISHRGKALAALAEMMSREKNPLPV
ncbi:MAG: RdgB/HAM1 family non-canonical purine NTP pyrophosphatase [Clostridiales Family XIII bacterium]|jgi:XTP/dITP diphosphohydrolase|nr:RdgB/HAM1 family non-canonical purine NTP pyrophosphatase [Clostridiales Family XIII bacterium]